MQIGELFLNLGVKGAEKTVGAISNITKGLGETASMSLEAKAGIVAATYALERLFAVSGHAGTALTNFNAVTGVSAQTLQEYQYAARQVGVSNEAVEASFKGLQAASAKVFLGEGVPKGLAQVSALVQGGLTAKDIENFTKNPQLLLQKLQEYAQKQKNVGIRNEVLKSFGVSDDLIAAFARNAFTPGVFKQAPTYSDKEIAALDKANIAWSNLGNRIQMAVGHFNALHGGQLVKEISTIVSQVIKLTESFVKLSEKLQIFKGLGLVFQGWSEIFNGIASAVNQLTGAVNEPETKTNDKSNHKVISKKEQLINNTIKTTKDIAGFAGYLGAQAGDKIVKAVLPEHAFDSIANIFRSNPKPSEPTVYDKLYSPNQDLTLPPEQRQSTPEQLHPQTITPSSGVNTSSNTSNQNIEVNQTLQFQHEGKDSRRTAQDVSQAIKHAFRQSPVLGQVT